MPRTALALVSFLTLALCAPAIAQDCTPGESRTDESQLVVSIPANAASEGYYVATDFCQPECLLSVWAYQETNGIPGLQRDDDVREDTCDGLIESDGAPGGL